MAPPPVCPLRRGRYHGFGILPRFSTRPKVQPTVFTKNTSYKPIGSLKGSVSSPFHVFRTTQRSDPDFTPIDAISVLDLLLAIITLLS